MVVSRAAIVLGRRTCLAVVFGCGGLFWSGSCIFNGGRDWVSVGLGCVSMLVHSAGGALSRYFSAGRARVKVLLGGRSR